MRHKGLKGAKRAAAVILAAALMVTDVQPAAASENVAAAVAEEETEVKISETETSETETSEAETEASEAEASETESSETESETQIEASETEISETETEASEEEEETEIEVKISGTEISETETSETETSETETLETEASETETESANSVPVPDVDDAVYEPADIDFTSAGGSVAIAGFYSGTLEQNEDGTYSINNKDQFLIFLASETDYGDSTVVLNCDVDMSGETAQFANTFAGSFDGNGHSIYNFAVSGGLFYQIGDDGEVKNLHLSGVTYADDTATAAVALTNNGKISNVTVTADINVTAAMTATAGIAVENSGTISGCVFAGSITADSDTDNAAKAIGGIVSENKGTVDGCYALGSISTNATTIGGIAARNYKTVKSCASYMSITGAYCIGGITAENTRTVTGCANYGAVTQQNSSDEGLAGGIAAKNTDTISDCANYAEISGAYKSIGGIAGSSSGTVTGCGNYAKVSGSENLGGIVGLFNGSGEDEEYLIEKSFNQGTVYAVSNDDSQNQGVGGILGAASKSASLTVTDCYNTADISGAADTVYIGGIAGILYAGSITGVYNAGTVTAADITDSFDPYAAMIAGFLGAEDDISCTGCLFLQGDSDTLYYRESGAVTATDEGVTADVLKSADALTILGDGFAADESSINGGYPIVSGQSAAAYQYVVLYELNGGSADYYFEVVQSGALIEEPDEPAKSYASFKGWYQDESLGTAYSFSLTVSGSMLLYAGWDEEDAVESITLAQSSVTLITGESFDLAEKVVFEPSDAVNTELTFSSSDASVASVSTDGVITAVAAGTATITVKLSDGSLDTELTFAVTVTDESNIVRFKLYGDETNAEVEKVTISMNDPVTVQAVFGATPSSSATVQWSSSNTSYVTVSERSDLVSVNAADIDAVQSTAELDNNYIVVTCTLIDSGVTYTGTLRVTVRPPAESISVYVGTEDATDKTVYFDIGTNTFVAVDSTTLSEAVSELSAAVLPKAADQDVEWSSSDSSVIKFSDSDSGAATGIGEGEATVTATAADGSTDSSGNAITGSTTVKARRMVQSLSYTPKSTSGDTLSLDANGRIEITEGTSIKLVPTYVPADATIQTVAWTNGNKNALGISANTSTNVLTVTAKSVADETVVKLTAETTDMSGISCEVEFVIKPKVEEIKIYRSDDLDTCVSGKNIGVDPETDSETFSLVAVNKPDNASQMVTWSIDDTTVAALTDNGDATCSVTVKKEGSAVITAMATDGSGVTAITTLNVTSMATSIEIEGSSMVMVGKSITLTATVYPKSNDNQTVTWESLMPAYASVNESTGVVTGIKTGYAVISATAADGSGVSSSHAVYIKDAPTDFDIMVPDGDDDEDNDEILTGETIGLDPDAGSDTYTVAARILPDTASQEVEWESSDETVATVEDGVITAKALGTATITASAVDGSGKTASVKVNVATLVKSIEITGSHYVGKGKSITLTASVGDKDAADTSLVWESEATGVATVSKKGVVKGVADGKATITATAADGSGVQAEYVVYVVTKKNDVDISVYDSDSSCEITTDSSDKKYIEDYDLADKATGTIYLKASLSGGSAASDEYPMDISWSSSDSSIAAVEASDSVAGVGVVTVYKAGTVKITAKTAEGYATSDYVTLTVVNTNPYVEVTGTGNILANGKSMQLSAGSVTVDWYSSNESLATVNAKGVVKAAKTGSGEVTITAKAVGGTHSGTYTVTVGAAVKNVGVTIENDGTAETVTGQTLGADLVNGYNGQSIKLGALLDGAESDNVTWKSSSAKIATIDEDGNVELLKNGKVTFTATATDGSKKKGKVIIQVTKQVTSMSPADDISEITVGYKKSVQLSVDYKPLASTTHKSTWVSSNPSVVSVNKSSGKITGKTISSEPVTVTATAADGSGVSCSFTVYVKAAVGKVEVVKSGNEYRDVVGIDLSSSTDTVTLTTNLYTKSGKEYIALDAQSVSWKSGNEDIATVDESGIVTGLKNGEVTITATATDGSKKSGKVKIYIGKLIKSISISDTYADGISMNLRTKKTLKLADELTISPITATNQKLTYTSSDKSVVSVNSSGKLTAKKAGTATVTVSPKDGSGTDLTITVTVTK
ncbi:MAG: Ig-like domain-containing protein [Lachnospiraceae bacterium]|nr:Ig-like domain-containing protein [Lachnospiraceae bacterium]